MSSEHIISNFKNQEKYKRVSQLKKDYDNLFSWYIRTRDGWTCQRCQTHYAPPTKSLQNSHFENRGNMATRFEEDNCMAACHACHKYHLEGKKHGEYTQIMKRILGESRYNSLMLKAEMGKTHKSGFSRCDYLIMISLCVKDLKDLAQFSPYKETILNYLKRYKDYGRE